MFKIQIFNFVSKLVLAVTRSAKRPWHSHPLETTITLRFTPSLSWTIKGFQRFEGCRFLEFHWAGHSTLTSPPLTHARTQPDLGTKRLGGNHHSGLDSLSVFMHFDSARIRRKSFEIGTSNNRKRNFRNRETEMKYWQPINRNIWNHRLEGETCRIGHPNKGNAQHVSNPKQLS